MKPRDACIHHYVMEPDQFVGYVTKKLPTGLTIGTIWATKGRCKKCGTVKKGRYIKWPVKSEQ